MSTKESLHDVTIREQQFQKHLLNSPEYLKRADRELKRQIVILYLAIALLILLQALFTVNASAGVPLSCMILVCVTSLLAIVNCLLLIQTKTWLHRLNEAWLAPEEKNVLSTIRSQREEILSRAAHSTSETWNAELN